MTYYIYNYDPISGYPRAVMSDIRRAASALTRNCDDYYIGITSSGQKGLSSRWYRKYQSMGYTDIVPLYTTTSDRFRRQVEAELIDFYGGPAGGLVANRIAGGGGPAGYGPYTVYIARRSK